MNKTNIATVVLMALHIICFANNTSETEYIYATDIDGVQIDTRDGLSENKIRSLRGHLRRHQIHFHTRHS